MRLSLSLLGAEVFAIDFTPTVALSEVAEHAEPEPGPPFGFSGGSGGYFEQAYPDPDDALPTPRRVE